MAGVKALVSSIVRFVVQAAEFVLLSHSFASRVSAPFCCESIFIGARRRRMCFADRAESNALHKSSQSTKSGGRSWRSSHSASGVDRRSRTHNYMYGTYSTVVQYISVLSVAGFIPVVIAANWSRVNWHFGRCQSISLFNVFV